MALMEENTLSQFDIDLKEAGRMSYKVDWNKVSAYKVYNFQTYSDKEKQ